jgi:hypothetical protein
MEGKVTRPPAWQLDWLAVARFSWIVITLLLIAVFIAGMQPRYRELTTICTEEPCIALTLKAQDAELLRELGGSLHAYAIYHIVLEILVSGVLALLGGLIFWQLPRSWFGLTLAYALALFGLNFMVESDSALVALHPGLRIPFEISTAVTAVLFLALFFIFPDGRFVPRWGIYPILVLTLVALFDPVIRSFGMISPSGQFSTVFLPMFTAGIFLGVYAQVYRFLKISTPVERQQTKWVIFGLLTLVAAILTYSVFVEFFPPESSAVKLAFNLAIFSLLAPMIIFFPVTFVISILRYRLWDIDLIVRRTLLYAIVTGTLALVYFGGVTILQSLLSTVTGQESTLAVVISTLGIAALFNPLRKRLQTAIDRRFYRRRYDAEQALTGFAQVVRSEVELKSLVSELVNIVDETIQPEDISLWLKPGVEHSSSKSMSAKLQAGD